MKQAMKYRSRPRPYYARRQVSQTPGIGPELGLLIIGYMFCGILALSLIGFTIFGL